MTKTICPVTQINSIFSLDTTVTLENKLRRCLNELHQDYFSEKTFDRFCQEHLGHISIVAKLLAYRFFSAEIFWEMKKVFTPHAEQIYGVNDLLLHPIFYVRYTFPELAQTEQHKNAFLDSQPHFDRSYGLYAYSFWAALVDIDEQSGGLCYFEDPEVMAHFSGGDKNKYSMDGYFENAARLDPLLKPAAIQPHIERGSILTFDSDVLHGATKPKTRLRLSFDMRLVARKTLSGAEPRICKIIELFNDNPTLCNANNLLFLGDHKGAARHFANLSGQNQNASLKYISDTLWIKPPAPEILKPGAKMQWRDEYCWIK